VTEEEKEGKTYISEEEKNDILGGVSYDSFHIVP
jgi:hypothetical protein